MKPKFFILGLVFLFFGPALFGQDWTEMMQNPNANVYEAYQNFNSYWAKNKKYKKFLKEKRSGEQEEDDLEFASIEEPRSIFLRWFNEMAPKVYPSGKVVNTAIALGRYKDFSKKFGSKKTAANWTFLGPEHNGGYTNNGSYKSPGGTGRVNAIAFDPNDPNTIWLGSPAGGVWKSTDGGQSWTLMNQGMEVLGVSAIAIDPTNSNIIYIGTGDRDAGDNLSLGIYKSTDGGQTWQPTSVTFQASQGARCTDILINPNNPNVLLASFNGIVYKTTDGFASKTVVLQDIIWDMEFKPGDPNTIYAAGTKFYRSTDGGNTFNQITSGIPSSNVQRLELAVSPAEPNSVWLLYGRDRNYSYDIGGVYKSTNSGSSFYALYTSSDGNLGGWDPNPSASNNSGGQAFYDLSLAVNPGNPNEIFVGGVNLYKSTNGGSSWTCSAYWLEGAGYPYAHADYHAIEYLNSSTLFVGNDGGIFKSTDNGNSWTDISNNLAIAQVARIGCSSTNPNLIMAGLQDNGTNKYNGTSWTIVYGGDGCEAICDPTNDNILYASYVNGALYRSTDGGSSWTSIKATSNESGSWITPYVMDPNDHNTLYAGYENVYKTTNAGSYWTRLGTAVGSGQIIELEVAPTNTDYIYYIKQYWNGSSMQYTVGATYNGGSSWYDIGSGLPISSAAPTAIAVSSTDPKTLWVTFSGYKAGEKVYKSTDAGQSWTDVSGNLPNIPVNAIVYQDGTDDGIYVGCDVGVYYKDNTMTDWVDFSTNLPKTKVRELEIYYDNSNPANSRLRAATYGRSVWESPLATSPTVCGVPSNLQAVNLTSTTAKLTWDPVGTAQSYDVRYKAVTEATWNEQNTTNTYLNISGLSTDDTQYEFQVRTNCSDGSSNYSSSAYFGYTPPTYCDSKGNNSSEEWIDAFAIGSINNVSGNNSGYGNYLSLSTDLAKGQTVNFTITPKWAGQVYNEGYAMWIDYNKDGDFDDDGEMVFSKAASQTNPVTGSFIVPSNIETGSTRLRVILRYNTIPSSCGTYDYGETEDYTVKIINADDNTPPTAPANLTYSNLTENSVDLSWDASTDNVGVTGYDVYENNNKIASVTGTSANVTNLQPSTSYSFYIVALDAAGNQSDESNVIELTTPTPSDNEAPTAPQNLTTSNITTNSVDLSWDASSDNVGVTGYRIYQNDAFLTTVTSTSYTVSNLSASTTYEFYVTAVDAAGNMSGTSNTVSVTTASEGITYCEAKGNNSSEEWIDRVQIGTIDNNSGNNGGYADFTNYSTDLNLNTTVNITLTKAWGGTKYDEAFGVWIDFNQDGDFEDSGELVFSSSADQNTPVSGSFTVPQNALLGQTRMRVVMRYNAAPSACGTFDYGEVEDYTVNIVDAGDIQAPAAPQNLTASNITTNSVDLSWDASSDNVGVSGYKIYKNGSYLTSVTSTSYTVGSLSASTTYQFYVVAYDDAGNVSDASNTVSVTTQAEEDTQAPSAPSNLVASNIQQTSLNLSWDASTDNIGVAEYLIYKDGAYLASTSNTYYTVTNLTASTSYQFVVKAKDAAGNLSEASNTINVTTASGGLTYCQSKGNTVSDEWIQRVQIGSIDNNSGVNGGYADFTNLSTDLDKTQQHTIIITPAWSGSVYDEAEAVWIDFNQNGQFENDELVATASPTTNSPVSLTFTIPSTALNGTTRMRVSMKYNGIPTACEVFDYGEVEDYTVNITGSADTQAPTDPSNLTYSNVTQTGVTLCWNASTDNVSVDKYNIYKDGVLYGYVDGSASCVNVTGLSPNTTYQFYVVAVDPAGNNSGQSNTVTVTTLPQETSYCDAQGNSVEYEWIDRVVLGSIDNNSGANGGYGDFTNLSTDLTAGSTYTIYLYPGFASSAYEEGWGVWIDYNHDGDFVDAGEQVVQLSATTSSRTASFTVPSTALSGNTRMRVSMVYKATPSEPCNTFAYGEVEDYTINITGSTNSNVDNFADKPVNNSTETENSIEKIDVYPNPVTTDLTIVLPYTPVNTQLIIYTATGAVVKTNKAEGQVTKLNVSVLPQGMYYLRIVGEKGSYNFKFTKESK